MLTMNPKVRKKISNKNNIINSKQYSPRKKYAKDKEEYSVNTPAISSDSDSGKSNGTLQVSIKINNNKQILKTMFCSRNTWLTCK